MTWSTHLSAIFGPSLSGSIVVPTPVIQDNYELKQFLYIMFILGSCKALNLRESGCYVPTWTQSCISVVCHCDQRCHSNNDCCSDIADIVCYPVPYSSPMFISTPTDTLGKTNFFDYLSCKVVVH